MGRQSSAFTQLSHPGNACPLEMPAWVVGNNKDTSQLSQLSESSLIQGNCLQKAPLFSLFVG